MWVGVCMCTHLHANLGVCMPVCTPLCLLHECVIDVYIGVCVYTLCVRVAHVHAPSSSCRMSYCDPIYFLSESANTTNLYMYCYKSCLATYCPMCVYCGCVVHVCIVLCILHCPSVAMHIPPPLHTHFIPLCHMHAPLNVRAPVHDRHTP